MALNRDDYCDECWLIVNSENVESQSKEGTITKTTNPEISESDPLKNITSKNVVENEETTITVKVDEPPSVKIQDINDSEALKSTIATVKDVAQDEETSDETEKLGMKIPSPKVSATSPKNEYRLKSSLSTRFKVEGLNVPAKEYPNGKSTKTVINFDTNIGYDTKAVKSNYSKKNNGRTSTQQSSTISFPLSILPSESEYLFGAKPNDSDLCLECLVIEHHHSFEKNLLQNVCGSSEEPHKCNLISVQKRPRKNIQVCEDIVCPRFKFWKIVDSAGAGWKVGDSSDGCFPPPDDIGITSCFVTSSGLCSKEQLIDLTKAGLSPHIMDDVRPDIEVSEWFCGRGDSTSRYGFKVSLLDCKQLMMNVYGQCVTLDPPESSRWRKVSYTFRNYMPGVRYILFHHGGSGELTKGRRGGGEGEAHPGSKMAGASVRVKLPRIPIR